MSQGRLCRDNKVVHEARLSLCHLAAATTAASLFVFY